MSEQNESKALIAGLNKFEEAWTARLAWPGHYVYSAVQSGEMLAAAVVDVEAQQVLRFAIGTRSEVEAMLFA